MNPFYEQKEIKTHLTKDKIFELISENTQQYDKNKGKISNVFSSVFTAKFFIGEINKDNFEITKNSKIFARQNTFTPSLKGIIEKGKLIYTISLHPIPMIFLFISLILTIMFLITGIFFLAILFLIIEFVWVIVYMSDVKKTNHFLENLLKK